MAYLAFDNSGLAPVEGRAPAPIDDPALRRMAVMSWHHGYTVPSHEVQAFLAAGFTPDQYETLMASIGSAKRQAHR